MGKNRHTIQQIVHHALFDNFSHEILLKNPLIIGFSGGPDSTALAHATITVARTHKLPTPILAHLNHQWRPDADDDADWCAQFAQTHNCPFKLGSAQQYQECAKIAQSREDAGRRMRREFLYTIAQEYRSPGILLAHHANDQVETVLMRLIRGTSLTGLTGIKYISPVKKITILRPFLDISKQDILDYLAQYSIKYLTDSSNNSLDFLRNRIRHELIPALIKTDPRAEANILRTVSHINTAEELVASLAQEAYAHTVDRTTRILDCTKFSALSCEIQRRVILRWLTDTQTPVTYSCGILDELIRFLTSPRGGTHHVSPTLSLRKYKNRATLSRNGKPSLHSLSPHEYRSLDNSSHNIADSARLTHPDNVP